MAWASYLPYRVAGCASTAFIFVRRSKGTPNHRKRPPYKPGRAARIIQIMPIDPSATVAATARVHPEASIGAQAAIGEFAIIEQDVVIGAFAGWSPTSS